MSVQLAGLIAPDELKGASLTCLKVFYHLIRGQTEKDIAEQLSRSFHTVHTHIKRIYRDVGVTSQRELAAVVIARLVLRSAKMQAGSLSPTSAVLLYPVEASELAALPLFTIDEDGELAKCVLPEAQNGQAQPETTAAQ